MPHISIKAEPLFTILGFEITNSILASVLVFFIFLLIALSYSSNATKKIKSKFFYFLTFALRSLYSLFESVFKERVDYFFPLVGAFFLFILLNNWFGLIPGVGSIGLIEHEHFKVPLLRANTADLNTTLALALISVVFTQYIGIKHLGLAGYLKKFINIKSPILFFTGLMETISEFSKIISFSFRLFGNIFAGEVILTVVAFLIPILASLPFFLFEVFVGFIQALVFSMLTAVFFNLAMEKSH